MIKNYLIGAALGSVLMAGGCANSPGNAETARNMNGTGDTRTTAGSMANSNMNSSNTAVMSRAANNVTTDRATADSDESFMKSAALGGMFEVEASKAVMPKLKSAAAKQFAQMMVTDHTKANNELKALAAKKSVALPTALDAEKQSMLKDMSGMTGAELDQAYVDAMVQAHQTDVALFKEHSQDATDPDVKAFATKTLPVLEKHLAEIQGIQAKM